MVEHVAFPKIPRLENEVIEITEKIDGTNALIYISDDLETVMAGSKSRWLKPTKADDNYGFAAWVEDNKDELRQLGAGYHHGEWWGKGIQRGYGMDRKVFSLFRMPETFPDCVNVVPFLGTLNSMDGLREIIEGIKYLNISKASAEFGVHYDNPEGIVLYYKGLGKRHKVIWSINRTGNDNL